ncbi:YIP1 family protein [Candidatus Pacearchaeota archaeon]|nr:YIP1 family protein [Candidatus Pacearchaeota archaeon]
MDLVEVIKKAKSRGYSSNEIVKLLLSKGYSQSEIYNAMNIQKKEKVSKPAKDYDSIEKIKMLFTSPLNFFDNVREETIISSLSIYSIIVVLVAVLNYGIRLLIPGNFFALRLIGNSLFYLFGYSYIFSFVLIVLQIAITFISALILHFIARIMGGAGNYSDSYNIVTYSFIPAIILSLIPIVGLFGWIFSLIIMVFGVSSIHNLSKGKSVFVVLLPIIVMFLLLIMLIFWFIFSFRF